jgi:NTP pyrophosphatase (non-canonical NTP hydrolase)
LQPLSSQVKHPKKKGFTSLLFLCTPQSTTDFTLACHGSTFHNHPMNDSIGDLTSRIRAFVAAREWEQFHNPKDMAVAIAAEAGELMQHFVWQQPDQLEQRVIEHREEIASEIADVGILLFEMADLLGMKLGDVMAAKIAYNEQRYPAEKSRGNNRKYDEL